MTHPLTESRTDGLTVDDVPITRHKSACSTKSSMRPRWCGLSPNHTTPGRARDPHLEQRGSAAGSISGSLAPCSTRSSVPERASQMGDVVLNVLCAHLLSVHTTSKSRPCISIRVGCGSAGSGGMGPMGYFSLISLSALGLRPSTFWVIRVKVESGAI